MWKDHQLRTVQVSMNRYSIVNKSCLKIEIINHILSWIVSWTAHAAWYVQTLYWCHRRTGMAVPKADAHNDVQRLVPCRRWTGRLALPCAIQLLSSGTCSLCVRYHHRERASMNAIKLPRSHIERKLATDSFAIKPSVPALAVIIRTNRRPADGPDLKCLALRAEAVRHQAWSQHGRQ